MGSRSKASGARIRCQSPIPRKTPRICNCSKHGCEAMRRKNCSIRAGKLIPELQALAPKGNRRMGANPHANGGLLKRELKLPDFRQFAVEVPWPGGATAEATRELGKFLREVVRLNPRDAQLPHYGPR